MNQAQSIWGCIEIDAASRDFDYANYLEFHKRTGCQSKVLSELNYKFVVQVLNNSIEEDISGN